VRHKPALEKHLAQKWRDLINATFDVLLYDLTSTYFEGEAAGVPSARRSYSRDHRPDCLQLVLAVRWTWDREAFRRAVRTEGAYLLRAHWTEEDRAKLWQTYTQLTEAEAAFRTLKSEIKVRPIWHWTESRVQAHLMVAFLVYCLWVYLKKCAQRVAPSLTPWVLLDQLGRIVLVEVWFELRNGGTICLPRITQPKPAQAVLLTQLGWTLPTQPPPRVHAKDVTPAG
jgi:hypothetical protein